MPSILHFASGDTLAVEQTRDEVNAVLDAPAYDDSEITRREWIATARAQLWHTFDVMSGTEKADVRLDQIVAVRSFDHRGDA